MVSASSYPESVSIFATFASGRGVILSIIDHGNATRLVSLRYSTNSLDTKPFSSHAFAMVITAFCSFSPLCEQLSIDTSEIG